MVEEAAAVGLLRGLQFVDQTRQQLGLLRISKLARLHARAGTVVAEVVPGERDLEALQQRTNRLPVGRNACDIRLQGCCD